MRTKPIRLITAVGALAMMGGGCSLTPSDAEEIEAVRDYIFASQLEEVEQIRFFQQMSYTVINDQFVTIPTHAGEYLVEFARICPELSQTRFTPEMIDYRSDNRTLRPRFDTIRGCRIGKIYEITEAQQKEIADLGDAPGDEVFLPDDDS